MKFAELMHTVADLPMFRGSLLLAGERDHADVRRQLSRWTSSGKLIRLRSDVYMLAKPWRQVEPHPFLIANELHRPSYVSLQSALAHHGLIPEAVPVTTSVTLGRPVTLSTPQGRFVYHHIQKDAFFGYTRTGVWNEQEALVAVAPKALLDLVYLTPSGDSADYLASLRLERLADISEQDLRAGSRRWGKPKLDRAVERILEMRARA